MHTELMLRFGYGAVVPWVTRLENGALRAIAGPGHGGRCARRCICGAGT